MVAAIEQITVYQGVDTRGSVLVGGGGLAGLNSVAIARRLGCESVVIPGTSATLSATGAVISDLHSDFRTLFFTSVSNFDYQGVNEVLANLMEKCNQLIAGPGAGSVDQTIELHTEARYKAQIWEIDVPLKLRRFGSPTEVEALRRDFDCIHRELFAFFDEQADVQFVAWRAVVRCRIRSGELGEASCPISPEKRPQGAQGVLQRLWFRGDTDREARASSLPMLKLKGR